MDNFERKCEKAAFTEEAWQSHMALLPCEAANVTNSLHKWRADDHYWFQSGLLKSMNCQREEAIGQNLLDAEKSNGNSYPYFACMLMTNLGE